MLRLRAGHQRPNEPNSTAREFFSVNTRSSDRAARRGPRPGYVLDHIEPLERGGADRWGSPGQRPDRVGASSFRFGANPRPCRNAYWQGAKPAREVPFHPPSATSTRAQLRFARGPITPPGSRPQAGKQFPRSSAPFQSAPQNKLLASARNARKTVGKATAVSAGLVVSRHEDYVVGEAGAVRFRKPGASLQGGYPPHAVLSHLSDEGHRGVVMGWTGSTGALVLGAPPDPTTHTSAESSGDPRFTRVPLSVDSLPTPPSVISPKGRKVKFPEG